MEKFYSIHLRCVVKQICIRTARKLFNEGETIYMTPSKLYFDNVWIYPFGAKKDSHISDFDLLVSDYKYCNCDYERGYYPRFYIKEK